MIRLHASSCATSWLGEPSKGSLKTALLFRHWQELSGRIILIRREHGLSLFGVMPSCNSFQCCLGLSVGRYMVQVLLTVRSRRAMVMNSGSLISQDSLSGLP